MQRLAEWDVEGGPRQRTYSYTSLMESRGSRHDIFKSEVNLDTATKLGLKNQKSESSLPMPQQHHRQMSLGGSNMELRRNLPVVQQLSSEKKDVHQSAEINTGGEKNKSPRPISLKGIRNSMLGKKTDSSGSVSTLDGDTASGSSSPKLAIAIPAKQKRMSYLDSNGEAGPSNSLKNLSLTITRKKRIIFPI
jgi:hypothetical protein